MPSRVKKQIGNDVERIHLKLHPSNSEKAVEDLLQEINFPVEVKILNEDIFMSVAKVDTVYGFYSTTLLIASAFGCKTYCMRTSLVERSFKDWQILEQVYHDYGIKFMHLRDDEKSPIKTTKNIKRHHFVANATEYCANVITVMRRVLISIDHKWRISLATFFWGASREKGIKVSYCRNGLEKYYLNHSYYDVVIINHIFEKSRQALVKEHSLKGTSFVILPTEGIPTLEDYTDFALGVELDYSAIRCYAFWNGFYQNRFEFNTTLSNQNIYIAGVPRFDFYKHKNLQKHINFNFTTSGSSKKILWATNFTQAQFHAPDKFDLMEADARRLGYKDTLESMQGSLQEVAKKDFFAREKSLEIMLKYIQQHSDVLLIIKPHPSEDGTYYKNYFKMNNISSKRVKIIKNEYIWDLLMWCDVEVGRSCTTAIEAWHKQTNY